jgi:hypothetical protein
MEDIIEIDQKQRQEAEEAYISYLSDLLVVAKTPEGARVVCEILERAGTFDTAWSPDNAQMVMSVVLKDFGQGLLDDLAITAGDVHDDIQRMMRRRRNMDLILQTNKGE